MSACSKCGKPMSAQAVVCPHCGARQADRDPIVRDAAPKKKALTKLTPEETAALLAVHGADRPEVDPHGGVVAVFLPHPAAPSWMRFVQGALTIAALPAIVSAAPLLMFTRQMRRMLRDTSGVWMHVLLAASGGASLYFSLGFAPVAAGFGTTITGIGVGALLLRGVLVAVCEH